MRLKVYVQVFLSSLLFFSINGMDKQPDQKQSQSAQNSKECAKCNFPSCWKSLLKVSCGHYFCDKCSMYTAKEYEGCCMVCRKPLFDFSNLPKSLSHEIVQTNRDRIKPKSSTANPFDTLVLDAHKILLGPNNPIPYCAPNARQMFHALKLARRAELGDIYDNEPFDCSASLEKKAILNSFWQKLESAPQTEKDEAVIALNKTFAKHAVDQYSHWRVRIAAAAYIKANVDVCITTCNRGGIYDYDTPLIRALDAHDESLIGLLLGCNVSVKTKEILFHARTRKVVEGLVRRGADVKEKTWSGHNLLEIVMQQKQYEADLVSFYREQGLSPVAMRDGLTPLHRLVIFHDMLQGPMQAIDKLNALMEGMLPQTRLELLHKKNTERLYWEDDVFGISEKSESIESVALYCYLRKIEKDAKQALEKEGCHIHQNP